MNSKDFIKLSVIIPCLNGALTIGALLEALRNQWWSKPWEIILADNGSTDETLDIVERYKNCMPNLRIVDASDRKGAAHARNVGAATSLGDALAFIDSDDEVAEGWVAAIGEALSRHDLVGSRFDVEKLNVHWILKTRENPQACGIQTFADPPYLPHVGGSGIGVKRALHEAIGGFDETWQFLEDTDYCWRLQLKGATIYFVHEAVVYCRFRNTLLGMYQQARNYAEFNVLLYKRYRPLGMPRISWRYNVSGIISFIRIFSMVPLQILRGKEGIGRFLLQIGWRMGKLKGSVKYRILVL